MTQRRQIAPSNFTERSMLRSRLTLLTILVYAAGCSAADRTAPSTDRQQPVTETQTVISALGETEFSGLPGEVAAYPPGISVAIKPGFTPVAGVKVVFTFSDGRASYSTVTNASGRAALDELRFDSRAGKYDIVATAAGIGSVSFVVSTIDVKVVATYDLHAVTGVQGPPFYVGIAQPGLTGAHYQLFDNGSYRFGYEWNGQTAWNQNLPYYRVGADRIEFYLSAESAPASTFYASRNYLFSTGTLSGNVMTVKYEDPVDFDDEEYVLEK